MRGRVPDKDAAFVPEEADLLVEKPVIGGQPGQKGERARVFVLMLSFVMIALTTQVRVLMGLVRSKMKLPML